MDRIDAFLENNKQELIDGLRNEITELKRVNNGLKWELSDAQYKVVDLTDKYRSMCESASAYMTQIMETQRGKFTYDAQTNEARLEKIRWAEDTWIKSFPQDFEGAEVRLDQIIPAASTNGASVAVHLHLYYTDLLDEFKNYFRNIPFVFDLYVSCRKDADVQKICLAFADLEHAQTILVRTTQNRGRDLAPLYVLFREEIAAHDIFLHVHSKKTLSSGRERIEWRTRSMDELCGSDMQVKRIFSLFQSGRKIGLFFPEIFSDLSIYALSWGCNKKWGQRLAGEYGFGFADELFNYPAGSFFWARTEAVRPLFNKEYQYKDFPAEEGQTDGTIAHALERAIAKVCMSRGYILAISDREDGVIRFNRSYQKLFKEYDRKNIEAAKYDLNVYDIVSFDIYETLIARRIFEQEDLFRLVDLRLIGEFNLDIHFDHSRKDAEKAAWEKKGASATIHDIYSELIEIAKLEPEMAEKIKAIEIEMECELCIPREDVKEIYDYLKRKGKKIYLTCDTYFTSDIVGKILEKCGYRDYDQMLLSCEMGMRKDDMTMWNYLADEWKGLYVIHVGDDFLADMQYPGDAKYPTYTVFSGARLTEVSTLSDALNPYKKSSVSTSIVMGTIVNRYLFNSPFALHDGRIRDVHIGNLVKTIYGPLLLAFVQSIEDQTDGNKKLVFLGENGEFLQRLMKAYYERSGRALTENHVLLLSKRTIRMANISSKADVYDILSEPYQGNLDEFLESRLGITDQDEIYGFSVKLPEQKELVMRLLTLQMPDLLEECRLYRNICKDYLAEVIGESKKDILLIDLNYDERTISALEKLLVAPHVYSYSLYLETDGEMVNVWSGRGKALFYGSQGDMGNRFIRAIPFLKTALQIQYGDLCSAQNEILSYADEFADFEVILKHKLPIDPEFALSLMLALLEADILPRDFVDLLYQGE